MVVVRKGRKEMIISSSNRITAMEEMAEVKVAVVDRYRKVVEGTQVVATTIILEVVVITIVEDDQSQLKLE